VTTGTVKVVFARVRAHYVLAMRKAAGLAIVASLLLVGAAACGGSSGGSSASGRPVKQWVTTFCTSISTWSKAVGDASTRLASDLPSASTDLAGAKARLVANLDESLRLTDTLITQLNDNGAPAVKNGAKIQSSVVGAFHDGRQVIADARTRAENLPNDPVTFAARAGEITTSINAGFDSAGKAFDAADKLDSDHQIANAGEKASACKGVSKS
jgi:hypothetical protein